MANGFVFIAGMVFGAIGGAILSFLLVGFLLHLSRYNDNETDYLEEE